MRPQNALLEIMDKVEVAGARTRNGLLVFKDSMRLQYIEYKNSASNSGGERIMIVPTNLEKKLRIYLELVRPYFGICIISFFFF